MLNSKSDGLDSRDIAIYTRVSTDEQAREGLSLSEQKHRLEAYCLAMGWKNDIVHFVDDGYSAKDIERPQLTALLKAVEEKSVSKIIVTKLDRLSRKLLNLLELIDVFQQNEVSFISISESFDTNTPSGRLTLQVLGAVAEFERERIRERVIDNMFHAANKGQWLTSAPYGYVLTDKELKVNPETSKIVSRIYHMYEKENKGFLTIAKALNEEGIPSPTGKEWWNRTIKLILTNPVYKGTTVWNRIEGSKKTRPKRDMEDWVIQENTHEAIIKPDTWDRIQGIINKRNIPNRAQSSPYLLSGLLKCPQCGSGMSVSSSGSNKVYRCSAYKNKGTCVGTQYKLNKIHDLFKEGLEDLLKHIPIETLSIQPSNKDRNTHTSIQKKLVTAKKRYERKVEAYAAELISLDDLKYEKLKLEKLEQEINEISNINTDLTVIEKELKEIISSVLTSLDLLPTETVKALLKDLFEKVIPVGENELMFVFKELS